MEPGCLVFCGGNALSGSGAEEGRRCFGGAIFLGKNEAIWIWLFGEAGRFSGFEIAGLCDDPAEVLGGVETMERLEDCTLEPGCLVLQIADLLFALFVAVSGDEGVALVSVFDGSQVGGDLFEMGECDEIGFERVSAFEAPLGIAKGLEEEFFVGTCRGEILEEFCAESFEGFGAFPGEDYGLAGEAVAERIKGGGELAFGGAWSGGKLRILLVG